MNTRSRFVLIFFSGTFFREVFNIIYNTYNTYRCIYFNLVCGGWLDAMFSINVYVSLCHVEFYKQQVLSVIFFYFYYWVRVLLCWNSNVKGRFTLNTHVMCAIHIYNIYTKFSIIFIWINWLILYSFVWWR